jgi:predicted membrane channel-forming protein YqfA (hemolysin III family)
MTGALTAILLTYYFRTERGMLATSVIATVGLSLVLLFSPKLESAKSRVAWLALAPFTCWVISYLLVATFYGVAEPQSAKNYFENIWSLLLLSLAFPYVACFGFLPSLLGLSDMVLTMYREKR